MCWLSLHDSKFVRLFGGIQNNSIKAVKLFPLTSPCHPLYAHACLWPLWFQLCCGCVRPPAEPGNSCMFALSRTCMGGVSCCCMRRGQSLAVTLAAGQQRQWQWFLPSLLPLLTSCQSRNFYVENVRISLCKDVISCIWLCPFKFHVLECIAAKSACTDAAVDSLREGIAPRGTVTGFRNANLMKFSRANCKVLYLGLEQSPKSVQRLIWIESSPAERDLGVLGHEKPDVRQKCVHAANDRQWHKEMWTC